MRTIKNDAREVDKPAHPTRGVAQLLGVEDDGRCFLRISDFYGDALQRRIAGCDGKGVRDVRTVIHRDGAVVRRGFALVLGLCPRCFVPFDFTELLRCVKQHGRGHHHAAPVSGRWHVRENAPRPAGEFAKLNFDRMRARSEFDLAGLIFHHRRGGTAGVLDDLLAVDEEFRIVIRAEQELVLTCRVDLYESVPLDRNVIIELRQIELPVGQLEIDRAVNLHKKRLGLTFERLVFLLSLVVGANQPGLEGWTGRSRGSRRVDGRAELGDRYIPELHNRLRIVILQPDITVQRTIGRREVVYLLAVHENLVFVSDDLDLVIISTRRAAWRWPCLRS